MCTRRYFTSFTSSEENTHTFRACRAGEAAHRGCVVSSTPHYWESKPGGRELPGEEEPPRRVTVWPGTPEWSVALSGLVGKHPQGGGTPHVGTAAAQGPGGTAAWTSPARPTR